MTAMLHNIKFVNKQNFKKLKNAMENTLILCSHFKTEGVCSNVQNVRTDPLFNQKETLINADYDTEVQKYIYMTVYLHKKHRVHAVIIFNWRIRE
jgi:hypothetical protein